MTAKTCKDCQMTKPLSSFYFDGDRARNSCKTCYRARVARNRRTNRATQKAYDRSRDAEKLRAREKLRNEVKAGRIIKPTTCDDCREQFQVTQIHGHHEDYAKPLEISWLCPQCHADRHKKERSRAEEV